MTRLALVVMFLIACGEKKAPPNSDPKSEVEAKSPIGQVEYPVVEGFATPAHVGNDVVTVTPTAIAAKGKELFALTDGRVPAAELEGGEMGMKINRLSQLLSVRYDTGPRPALQLAIDKRVPYRTFIQIVYSAKLVQAGFKNFTLLAKSPHDTLAEAPFKLPEPRPAAAATRRPGADLDAQLAAVKNAGSAKAGDKEPREPARKRPAPTTEDPPVHADLLVGDPPANEPVRLVVSITKSELRLWSFSGVEGTLKDPKLKLPPDGVAAPLRKALEEIVARRGREQTESSILLMADGDVPMQRIAEIIGAVRVNADGKPLFPDLMFSAGFE